MHAPWARMAVRLCLDWGWGQGWGQGLRVGIGVGVRGWGAEVVPAVVVERLAEGGRAQRREVIVVAVRVRRSGEHVPVVPSIRRRWDHPDGRESVGVGVGGGRGGRGGTVARRVACGAGGGKRFGGGRRVEARGEHPLEGRVHLRPQRRVAVQIHLHEEARCCDRRGGLARRPITRGVLEGFHEDGVAAQGDGALATAREPKEGEHAVREDDVRRAAAHPVPVLCRRMLEHRAPRAVRAAILKEDEPRAERLQLLQRLCEHAASVGGAEVLGAPTHEDFGGCIRADAAGRCHGEHAMARRPEADAAPTSARARAGRNVEAHGACGAEHLVRLQVERDARAIERHRLWPFAHAAHARRPPVACERTAAARGHPHVIARRVAAVRDVGDALSAHVSAQRDAAVIRCRRRARGR